MRVFSKRITISNDDLKKHLEQYGYSLTSNICIPAIKESHYTYTEKTKKKTDSIINPIPFGMRKKHLPRSLFMLIDKSGVNAFATEVNSVPVIGMHTDSISEIMYHSTLFVGMCFEENFDTTKYKYNRITILDDGIHITQDNSLLGYKDERIISYMLSEAALRFMVLHEIGHHINKHISLAEVKQKAIMLMANEYSELEREIEREIEADTYAVEKYTQEYSLILRGLKKCRRNLDFSDPNQYKLMALNILIGAMTLPFSLLYPPQSGEITKENYRSTIAYRESRALIFLGINLFKNSDCKDAVMLSLLSQNHNDFEEVISNEEIREIKANHEINFKQFMLYIVSAVFSNFKQLYYNVNNINNRQVYLNNYLEVIKLIQSEDKEYM